jgi:anti-anti-sigma factor
MQSRITCEVRDDAPVTVVRLAGLLDLGTMRSVHGVLHRCLTAQPDALVVDLTDVRVLDRLALSVFAATARQAADWPAVPVVLCSPPREAARWLAESTACRVVPVRRDCAEATLAAGEAAALSARPVGAGGDRPPAGPSWPATPAAGGTCPTWSARPRWCSASWSATWCGTPAPRWTSP